MLPFLLAVARPLACTSDITLDCTSLTVNILAALCAPRNHNHSCFVCVATGRGAEENSRSRTNGDVSCCVSKHNSSDDIAVLDAGAGNQKCNCLWGVVDLDHVRHGIDEPPRAAFEWLACSQQGPHICDIRFLSGSDQFGQPFAGRFGSCDWHREASRPIGSMVLGVCHLLVLHRKPSHCCDATRMPSTV